MRTSLVIATVLSLPLAGACSQPAPGKDAKGGTDLGVRHEATATPDRAFHEAGTHDAGPDMAPDALAFTWASAMQTQFTSFCERCHTGKPRGSGPGKAQDFTCLYCYDPSTGACAPNMAACGTGTVPGVAQFSHIIICGVLPASTPASAFPTCPDPKFGVPFGQFPADCNLDDPTLWSSKCPTDSQRLAIVHWIQAGDAP